MTSWRHAACCAVLVWFPTWADAVPPVKPVPPKVYAALKSSSLKVRLKAVDLISHSTDPAAPPVLLPLLQDKDPVMRAAACDAFGELRFRGAVAAIKALLSDDNELVKKRAAAALQVLLVPVEAREVVDNSAAGFKGLAGLLKKETVEKLTPVPFLDVKALEKDAHGYAVQLAVQSVKLRKDGNDSVVEVVNSATVTEMPANALRFSTRITAGAAIEGTITAAQQQELAEDAIRSAAPALAEELATWFGKPR